MTKALQKALDLYPEPEQWRPAAGVPDNVIERATPEQAAAITHAIFLRGTLLSDEWPRMVRAFATVMGLPRPDAPTALTAADLAEHVNRLMREVNDLAAAPTLLKQADEAFDIIYLAIRLLGALGLSDTQILAGFTECHASNMTKVMDDLRPLVNDGEIDPTQPIGKVLKTHNYVAPDYATAMSIEP